MFKVIIMCFHCIKDEYNIEQCLIRITMTFRDYIIFICITKRAGLSAYEAQAIHSGVVKCFNH